MPRIEGIVENCLHAENLQRSASFYRDVMQLQHLAGDDRFQVFAVPGREVLILFKKDGTVEPFAVPGGVIPPHGGAGQLHVGFAIAHDALPAWEAWLKEKGVAIEGRVTWPRGGTSLYFRDPDQHLLELLTPGVWANY